MLTGLQGLGIFALGVVTTVSGFRHGGAAAQVAAQGAYFIVLALLIAAVAAALWRGRRWGRTPAIVVQVVVIAVGVWMIAPSGRIGWGTALLVVGLVIGGLLVSPAANRWIRKFPLPFGSGPDQ